MFGEYVLFAIGVEPTEVKQKGLVVGLLTFVTVMHGCFLKTGIRIQNLLGWVKLGMIGFMALVGTWVVIFGVKSTTLTTSDNKSATSPAETISDKSWSAPVERLELGMGHPQHGDFQGQFRVQWPA